MIPKTFKTRVLSLKYKIPIHKGIDKEIFVATETNESPLRCVVIAARLKTMINRRPSIRVP